MGTVTESNTDRTTIDFDDHGVKKFVTSIWSAELVGEAPAQPPTRRRGRRQTPRAPPPPPRRPPQNREESVIRSSAFIDAKSSASSHDRLRASSSPQPIFVCRL